MLVPSPYRLLPGLCKSMKFLQSVLLQIQLSMLQFMSPQPLYVYPCLANIAIGTSTQRTNIRDNKPLPGPASMLTNDMCSQALFGGKASWTNTSGNQRSASIPFCLFMHV